MSLAAVADHLAAHVDEHVAKIQTLIRQPSVSLELEGLGPCADLVAKSLAEIGCKDAAVIDVGDAYPGVFGSLSFGRPKTLLVYGHYDVRPVGVEPWSDPPFSGALKPFAGFPRVVMGRGAAGKGPMQAFINTVGSMLTVDGTLPVNLVFLLEGAEILGSPNYPKLVEARYDAVRKASALYGPRASQDMSGAVSVTLGYKGLIYLELTASGAAWGRGPQGAAVHSATQAVVDNPAWRLIQALATMTDSTGVKVTVPAVLDAAATPKPIAEWERPYADALVRRGAAGDINGVIPGLSPGAPVKTFRGDATGGDVVRQYMYGPSFNISGLRAGYTGPGTKSFLLPDKATATLDIRLISETKAPEILAGLRAHLDAAGFPDIAIDAKCVYDWNQTSIESDLIRSALGLLEKAGHPVSIWPMQAFGGPWAHFAKTFGIPSVMGAAPGHGGRVPTSDEYFVIEGAGPVAGLLGLETHFATFLHAYASA